MNKNWILASILSLSSLSLAGTSPKEKGTILPWTSKISDACEEAIHRGTFLFVVFSADG